MIRNLLLLLAIVGLAALTTSCGVKKDIYLPNGQERKTIL